MRDYIIMTDSCCDLPAELVSELELTVLPLSFCIEGRELYNFPDNREMDPKVFYEKLRNGAATPGRGDKAKQSWSKGCGQLPSILFQGKLSML